MLPRIIWNYALARRSHSYSKQGLKDLQYRKLRRLLTHAYSNVELYRRRFDDAGVTPSDIKGLDDLRRLPVLTRKDIFSVFPDGILAKNRDSRNVIVRHTSGTTGRPLEVYWDNSYCDVVTALRLLNVWSIGAPHWSKTVDIIYVGRPSPVTADTPTGGKNPTRLRRFRKLLVGPMITPTLLTPRAKIIGFKGNISEVAEPLMKFKPGAVQARPSYLRRLGHMLEEEDQGRKKIQIDKLVTGGEFLSKRTREDLHGLFDAEVFNGYGTQEFGPLAMECREHAGMHMNSDYFIIEFVKDNEPVSYGEAGDVLITSLHNELMPMIRYKIGDIAIPEEDEKDHGCECGLHLPRIKELQGRLDDGLVSQDLQRVPTSLVVDYLESELGLRDYQMIQLDMKKIRMKVKESPALQSRDLENSISKFLKALLGEECMVEIEVWRDADIPPKYRPVISKVELAATAV